MGQEATPWFPLRPGMSWTYSSSTGGYLERAVTGDTLVGGELHYVLAEERSGGGTTVRYVVRYDGGAGRLVGPPSAEGSVSQLAPCPFSGSSGGTAVCDGTSGKPETYRVAEGTTESGGEVVRVRTYASEVGLDVFAYEEGRGPSLFTVGGELFTLVEAVVPAEEEPAGVLAVAAWPNPTRGPLTVSYPSLGPGGGRVEAFDALGRRVAESDLPPAPEGGTVPFDFSGAPGAYFVRVSSSDGKHVGSARVVRVQ